MENEILIYYKNKEIKAQNRLDESFSRYEYINFKLDMLRKMLKNMIFSKGSDLVDVELYVFDSKEINA